MPVRPAINNYFPLCMIANYCLQIARFFKPLYTMDGAVSLIYLGSDQTTNSAFD